MDGHLRAFSFVDRITALQPGQSIRGSYAIPAGLEAFPSSLVAEAVGQLAAWAAMAAVHFTHRPVAGIAGRVELLALPQPGQQLSLAAEIESVDTDSVAYRGLAEAAGAPILRLVDCVGPMVPMEIFDDPQLVRERFHLLCQSGAPPGGFEGLPALSWAKLQGEPGRWARATLPVPTTAPFFADHFPRRAVFPGTLLMHANLQMAMQLAAQVPAAGQAGGWVPHAVSEVKLRSFVAPGQQLLIEVKVAERAAEALEVAVETRNGAALVGSAVVRFLPASPS